MKKINKVSVIVNCYNSERFLKETLISLVKQTYKNWELIFYDNNSDDKSYKIFKTFKDKRFKYYKSKKFENLGLARKNALLKATGEYVAFLDSDDVWLKNKLKVQLKYFKNNKVGFVISNTIFFNEFKERNYLKKYSVFENKIFYKLIENYFISFDSIIIKSIFLQRMDQTLDQRFNIIHDMDLIIRLSKICEMRYAPFVLSKWRMRNDSLSFNNFGNIISEKKLFIKKINKKYKNDLKFIKCRVLFMDALYRQEVLYFLTQKKTIKSLKLIKKLNFNGKNLVLFIIIFLPFKKYIFRHFLNIKF